MARKKTARTARQAVLDGTPVTLLDGTRLVVRPWGIELSDQLLPILGSLVQDVMTQRGEIAEMQVPVFIAQFSRQIDAMVQITIGYDDEQMRKLTLEDGLKLKNAVATTCIIREDGGGPLGELLRLYGVGSEVIRTVLSPAIDEMTERLPKPEKTNSSSASRSSSHGVRRLPSSENSQPN